MDEPPLLLGWFCLGLPSGEMDLIKWTPVLWAYLNIGAYLATGDLLPMQKQGSFFAVALISSLLIWYAHHS